MKSTVSVTNRLFDSCILPILCVKLAQISRQALLNSSHFCLSHKYFSLSSITPSLLISITFLCQRLTAIYGSHSFLLCLLALSSNLIALISLLLFLPLFPLVLSPLSTPLCYARPSSYPPRSHSPFVSSIIYELSSLCVPSFFLCFSLIPL